MERAKNIVRSTNYPHSNMDMVDRFISNPTEFLRINRATLRIPTVDVCFDTTFVALAAPSLEGKTQTAFTLRRSNPLYFPLNAACSGESKLQEIYVPFIDHAVFLRGLAVKDLEAIRTETSLEGFVPTVNDLKTTYRDEPLFVLGFFAEIMRQTVEERRSKHATVNQAESTQLPDWMNFYATKLEPFDCQKMKVDDFILFRQSIGEPFCLFLDEFLSKEWSVYIRNLARAVGLICIVSNTNTNIANLVSKGVESSREGAGQDRESWSLVFRRLNNIDKQAIDVDVLIRSIQEYCPYMQSDELSDSIFADWFYCCRPGIAIWILEAMHELFQSLCNGADDYLNVVLDGGSYSIESAFTIGSFLQFLCIRVSEKLLERKRRMASRLNGQVAKLGILTDIAYQDSASTFALHRDRTTKAPTTRKSARRRATRTAGTAAVPATTRDRFEPFRFIQFLENHL